MSNSDIDLSRPLLQDDELAYDEELSSNGFEEDLKQTTRLEALRTGLNTFWRYHRRRVVLGLSYTSAAALTLLVLFIVIASKTSNVDIDVPEWNETLAYDPRLEKYQSPEDWQLCPTWSPPQPLSDSSPSKYTSTVSFSLPTTPDLTFFLTRGSPIVGTFTLHEERAQGDEITVDVIAEYDDINEGQDVLGSTKACFAWRKEGGLWEQGILLWADPSLADSTHVHYNISVRLPNTNVFNEISTDFTNPGSVVDQVIGGFFDIWRPTGFGPVRLNSRDAPIKVQTLMGSEMYVSTTNARVDGHFWVSRGAHVQTSNAPVFSTVWAIGHEQGANISTSIRTNNGPVFAALTIASDFTHIKLNASIHTTNGNLTIISPRAMVTPYPSIYLLSGSTTNAPIQVHLHPEYEGAFDLRTAGPVWEGRTDLVWDNEAAGRDPAGEGRTRKLDWEGGRNERRRKSGRIFWGEPEDVKEERMGDIKLSTTRKDVLLVAQRGPVDRGLS